MELKLGDKLWINYGPNAIVVGHLVDSSPDNTLIGLSPVPYAEYIKMSSSEQASCPISWFETYACTYRCHIPFEDIQQKDSGLKPSAVGFGLRA